MKYEIMVLSVLTSLLVCGCEKNDFKSTKNATTQEDLANAKTGAQITIHNRLPKVNGANGVDSVIHLNAQVCNWTDLDEQGKDGHGENQKKDKEPSALSKCYDLKGTIHAEESETYLIPEDKFKEIVDAGKGKIKVLFKSSTQGSNYYQGCLGSIENLSISEEFLSRKTYLEVTVNEQDSIWGYRCDYSAKTSAAN